MPKHITIHPLANLFPSLAEPQRRELIASMREHGQMVPVVIDSQNRIIDGVHRSATCDLLGIEMKTVRYKGPEDDASILRYITGLNLARRHLSEKQRAALAAEMANMPAHRPSGESAPIGALSLSEAAELMHVSRRSVQRAKKRMREDPEAHEAVKRGEKPAPVRKPEPLPEDDANHQKARIALSKLRWYADELQPLFKHLQADELSEVEAVVDQLRDGLATV